MAGRIFLSAPQTREDRLQNDSLKQHNFHINVRLKNFFSWDGRR